jgi:deoxycytidine triphosphate deaminase
MIVGNEIITRKLVKDAKLKNLKNGTFDLSIGDIIPIGKEGLKQRRSKDGMASYVLDPREMVWILSAESFNMPSDVTGIATLRTAFTQQGMLALNVGIIDPLYKGPISTALINFSNVPRELKVGTPFFRVVFLEHSDVKEFNKKDESRDGIDYLKTLEEQSLKFDFPQNFLSIPKLDDKYYADIFGRLVWGWVKNNSKKSGLAALILAAFLWYICQDGFGEVLLNVFKKTNEFLAQLKIK